MITEIKNRYLAKFDELNVIGSEIMVKPNEKEAGYFFDDILIDAYVEGFLGAQEILKKPNVGGITMDRLKEVVNQKYDGVSIQEKLIDYYKELDQEALNRLLEDEYHRAYTTGQLDGAEAVAKSENKGKSTADKKESPKQEILKKWVTVGDEKVRKDHQALDGVEIPLTEKFKVAGDEALAPGGFKSARLNVNCRCMLDFVYNA